jgi:hypothetical protein
MIIHNLKIPKNSYNKNISILIIFYIILSTFAIFDIFFLINFIIKNSKESKILLIIFTIIYPLILLINSLIIYFKFLKNSDFLYHQINDNLEIINSIKIYEVDYRYINEKFSQNFIIIIISSILSYTKLIIIHIFINAYKNSSKFSFFHSLKSICLKIISFQLIFQTIPIFIIKNVVFIEYNNNDDNDNKNRELISLNFNNILEEYWNRNFIIFISVFIIYIIFYNFYFKKFEVICIEDYNKDLIERKKTNYTDENGTNTNSIKSWNYRVYEEENSTYMYMDLKNGNCIINRDSLTDNKNTL